VLSGSIWTRSLRYKLTSEDPAFPIENALGTSPERNERGWRATNPGPQTITLSFDAPQHIRRIFLQFIERETERVQEFVLRYASASETDREIVRQLLIEGIAKSDKRVPIASVLVG
jgi:hypothetical protein